MKVAHLMNELRFSGAEVMLAAAADAFLKAGPALVIGTGNMVGNFAPTLEAAGYGVAHKPFSKSPRYYRSLGRFLVENSVDLVHIHSERSAFAYSLMARCYGLASVRTVHNEFNFTGQLRLRRIGTRRAAAALGTAHVACSPSVQKNELDRFTLNTDLINNWMDPVRIPEPDDAKRRAERGLLGLKLDSLVAISIANEAPAKNLVALFEGVNEAAKLGVDVRLFHCGEVGPELQELADHSVNRCVTALGTVANIKPYLTAADVFVSTSFNEGGQISLLEAAASGLSCITTKVGNASVFEDQPGVTFIGPDASSLRDAIVATSKVSADTMREKGFALATWARNYFTPARGAREYIRLYERQCYDRRNLLA